VYSKGETLKSSNELERQVIHWLKEGLTVNGKTQSALADFCGVSRQAVGEWLKTGKVHKKHFSTIGRYIGLPPSHSTMDNGVILSFIESGELGERSAQLLANAGCALASLDRDLTPDEFTLLSHIFNGLRDMKKDALAQG